MDSPELKPRFVDPSLADAGQEKLKVHDMLAEWAAYGSSQNGKPKAAVLTSDAETGWTLCVHHGHCKSVDPASGKWARNGVCEHCFRQDHSPESIAFRVRETAGVQEEVEAQVRARAHPEAPQLAAGVEGDGVGPASTAPEPERRAVAPGPEPPVRRGVDTPPAPTWVRGPEAVGTRPADDGTAGGPGGVGSDLSAQWLRITGVD